MTAEAPAADRALVDKNTGPVIINSANAIDVKRDPWSVLSRRRPERVRRPKPPLPSGAAFTVWMLLTLSAVALWVLAFALVLSGMQTARDQHELYGSLREQLALATAPLGGVIAPGSPVAVVQIPVLGKSDLVVLEGTAAGDLQSGPGHRRDTVLPGQEGVSVLFGRSVMFGAPFAAVTALQPGDKIGAVTGQGEFTYVVDRVRHIGDPLPPPLAAGGARLTLVTSEGFGWQSGWAPNRSVYVDATLRGKSQPAPGGRPRAIPMPEQAMQGDAGALVGLVLWLAALVLAVVGVVWGRARWGRWQTWLVGAPLVLAAAWGSTQLGLQLLPNLF